MNTTRTAVLVFVLAFVFCSQAAATIHNVNAGPGLQFFPPEVWIAHGDTVRWEVVEGIHTTTSDVGSAKIWDSGNMGVGGKFDVVFTAPDGLGPFPYRCELHWLSGMLGTVLIDNDGDGWSADIDCDDNDPSVNPGAPETCNGIDDDCNTVVDDNPIDGTTWYEDSDGDGYGNSGVSQESCSQPSGYVDNDFDCDDGDVAINPNTVWYEDADNDGFGNLIVFLVQCTQPPGYVLDLQDCDDADPAINPNTIWYEDSDGDGFGNSAVNINSCVAPSGYVLDDTDCDDTDAQIGPCTCCLNDRGNANNDPEDKANVSDVSYLVSWLFGIPSGPAPVCIEEANANGDFDEKANVSDVSYLVAWLFGIPSGPAPPACP